MPACSRRLTSAAIRDGLYIFLASCGVTVAMDNTGLQAALTFGNEELWLLVSVAISPSNVLYTDANEVGLTAHSPPLPCSTVQ